MGKSHGIAAFCAEEVWQAGCCANVMNVIHVLHMGLLNPSLFARGAGKAKFNVATPTYATVTCRAYVLLYNLQTKSI